MTYSSCYPAACSSKGPDTNPHGLAARVHVLFFKDYKLRYTEDGY